jgi:hypothetical protein
MIFHNRRCVRSTVMANQRATASSHHDCAAPNDARLASIDDTATGISRQLDVLAQIRMAAQHVAVPIISSIGEKYSKRRVARCVGTNIRVAPTRNRMPWWQFAIGAPFPNPILERSMAKNLWSMIIGCGVAIAFAAIAGCATPVQRNYFPKVTEISEPPIGSVNTASVGDSMLLQGRHSEMDAVKLPRPIKIDFFGGDYTLDSGYYVKYATTGDGEYYIPEFGAEGGQLSNSSTVTEGQGLHIAKGGKELCSFNLHGDEFCTDDFDIERVKRAVSAANSFQQTLIYSGRVGNRINIGYRETSGDAARPAFNNEVEYDLNESKVIAYKGAELEIIDATNRSITFRVLKNFNDARQ